MIHHLAYRARFASTGRVLEATVDLSRGFTVVTGPNESGKSFLVEMLRFALFGSAALRDKISDFAELKVRLEVDVRGTRHVIDRSRNDATVSCAGAPLAVGTKPANAKIIELLGFNLDVFDLACVSNQGEVTKLGELKPAERRALVDQVLGLDRLEALGKWCGDEAAGLTREADAVGRGLVAPVSPQGEPPARDAVAVERLLVEARAVEARAAQLRWILRQERTAPVRPVPPCEETAADLDTSVALLKAHNAELARLRAIPVVDYDVDAAAVSWEAWDAYQKAVRFMTDHPAPVLTRQDVDAAMVAHGKLQALRDAKATLARLERSQSATCPDCGSTFSLEHAAIAEARARVAEIGTVEDPIATPAELLVQARRLDDWAKPDVLAEAMALSGLGEVPKPTHPRTPPAGAVTREARDALVAVHGPQHDHVGLAALADERRRFEALMSRYADDVQAHAEWESTMMTTRRELDALPVVDVPALEAEARQAAAYADAMRLYDAQVTRHAEVSSEVSRLRVDAEAWKAARTGLAELRGRIKGHVVPPLNRVASHLLATMTGGQRQSVAVDEDFDVKVDGQSIRSLSGSGKVCANLALRVGLGQVLTHGVMPVFIGDEIDASMDVDRAEQTQKMLHLLKSTLAQVIVITHKDVEGDQRIALG